MLIGYDIEISFMFALMGIVACSGLPRDRKMKILGVNNRLFFIVVLTTASVAVECFLNYRGLLAWEYPWWSRQAPWLVWLVGYAPFFTMAFGVHDMERMRSKLVALSVLFGTDLALLVGFGAIGWMRREVPPPARRVIAAGTEAVPRAPSTRSGRARARQGAARPPPNRRRPGGSP
ncbi:MAG: hypothetical protein JNG85_11240 [Spirochaetaceae bacterium]|nr:hypothetical protein [Spirochaetaceae bacterium]